MQENTSTEGPKDGSGRKIEPIKMNIIRRKIIEMSPSETLADISGKTKARILAEKFLVESHAKFAHIARSLRVEENRMKLFWSATGVVPIAMVLYFFLPIEFFGIFLKNEGMTRLAVATVVGFSIANGVFLRQVSFRAFLCIPLSYVFFLYPRLSPPIVFAFLFESEVGARLFLCLGFSFVWPPIFYLCGYVLWRITSWLSRKPLLGHFFGYPETVEMEKRLSKTLAELDGIKEKEMRDFVLDIAPNYRKMLNLLAEPKEMELEAPSLEDVDGNTAPKNMHLPLYIGVGTDNQPIYRDLVEMPHMCIGGTSGSGKSNFIRTILGQLSEKNVHFSIIDPKRTEFGRYRNKKNVTYTNSIAGGERLIHLMEQEMYKRMELFERSNDKDIQEYGGDDLSYHVLIIDEYFFFAKNKALDLKVTDMASIARSVGIHIILSTQRPSAKILNEQLRVNLGVTVAFSVRDIGNSRVLGAPNAHKIKKSQKGLCYLVDGSDVLLVQTPLAKSLPKPTNNTASEAGKEIYGEDRLKNILLAQEGLQPVSVVSKTEPTIDPAEKGEEGAIFVTHRELTEKFGQNPQNLVFEKTRQRINGKRMRGYWVKKIKP